MANIVTLPVGIDFLTWANQIRDDLPNISVPLATSVENWRYWANQLIAENEIAYVPIATRVVFRNTEDWRYWAIYFIETLNL